MRARRERGFSATRRTDDALRRLFAAMTKRTVLRRTLSIVCAVVFLAVGFAHSVQHFDGAVAIAASQTVVSSADDSPEAQKQGIVAPEHCFACTMIAMPLSGQSIAVTGAVARSVRSAVNDVRAHPPATDTRPPITAI